MLLRHFDVAVRMLNADKRDCRRGDLNAYLYFIICTYTFYASSGTVRRVFQPGTIRINDASRRVLGKERGGPISIQIKPRYFHFRPKFITKFI